MDFKLSSLFGLAYLTLSALAFQLFSTQAGYEPEAFSSLFSLWYIAICLLYLGTLARFRSSQSLSLLAPILLSVILCRFVFAFTPVILTGDLPRYVWEGGLIRHGISPYIYPPSAVELRPYRTELWGLIEYKQLTAIYPPAAELLLAGLAWSTTTWKLFLCMFELLSLATILCILKWQKRPIGNVLYYACLPLALIEVSGSGHFEGVLVFLSLAAYLFFLYLKESPNFFHSNLLGITAALAILTKYTSGLFFLCLACKNLPLLRRRDIQFAMFSALVFGLLLLFPFLDRELSLFSSLKAYLTHWHFNDSSLHLLGFITGADWKDTTTFSHLKIILLGLWGVVLISLLRSRKKLLEIVAFSYAIYLLISPVVHPWYGLWFAMYLPFVHSRALLYFALALPFSYYPLLSGTVDVPLSIKLLEYLPVYILLIYEFTRPQNLNSSS